MLVIRRYKTKSVGFTLLEVLVALAIVSVGLLAVSSSLTQSISVTDGIEQRTIATWLVGNRMSELRMERAFTSSGSTSSETKMAGRNWKIVENYFSTANPKISRIVIEVFPEASETKIFSSTGYLAKSTLRN
jgi:general secretion pathway protein I